MTRRKRRNFPSTTTENGPVRRTFLSRRAIRRQPLRRSFPFTGKTTGCGSRSWSWRRSLRSPECTCTSIFPRTSWEAWPWAGYAPWRDRLYPGVCSLRHNQEIVLAFLFPLHYNSFVIQYVLRGGVRFPTGGDSPRPAKCS